MNLELVPGAKTTGWTPPRVLLCVDLGMVLSGFFLVKNKQQITRLGTTQTQKITSATKMTTTALPRLNLQTLPSSCLLWKSLHFVQTVSFSQILQPLRQGLQST